MRDRPMRKTESRGLNRFQRIGGWVAVVLLGSPSFALAAGKLEIYPDPWMLGLLTLIFFALVIPVNALVFKPIFQVLDDRDHRIDGARVRAAEIAEQTEHALAQYEESLRQARSESDQARKETIESARHEQAAIADSARGSAEALMDQARSELSVALEEATASLRGSSEELGRLAAERILGRSL